MMKVLNNLWKFTDTDKDIATGTDKEYVRKKKR